MISELKDNNIDIELYKDDKDFATLENLTNFASLNKRAALSVVKIHSCDNFFTLSPLHLHRMQFSKGNLQ